MQGRGNFKTTAPIFVRYICCDLRAWAFLRFLERKAYLNTIQMIDPISGDQAPEVFDSRKIKTLWQVCATIKKW